MHLSAPILGTRPRARDSPVQVPTPKELAAISKEALLLVFSQHSLAQITRPRNSADDVKAAAYLKAQVTHLVGASGWVSTSAEADFHPSFFGCQVTFRH